MFLLWLRQLLRCGDQTPASVPPSAEGRPSPTNTSISPLVPSSYWVLCGSIYSFLLTDTPVCPQLVFRMHFCVWRCIPDVSVEKDVLHIHLLLCHLVLPPSQVDFNYPCWNKSTSEAKFTLIRAIMHRAYCVSGTMLGALQMLFDLALRITLWISTSTLNYL